ncbi:MBL fold metallo-hydrolase [Clostridium oryzae]|uniref:Ribonuclease n=1 Tax=Clostridium oryzae TaxID=1450648 RepID=A0A1V4IYU9_9CLOT|nr:MBL fold metallo-hydrolase [Clostridium oryzae]OPJ65079.1 ribonuclease [Clostridium oryzae]
MKVTFCGGAYEVGASCILLNIDNKNILLDCGIRQSQSKDILPDFRLIQEYGGVDAIIISHAHMDHTGSLPIISKEYPYAKIYMNIMTKDLLRVLLYDSIKIMSSKEAEIPIYSENDIVYMLDRVHTINYEVDLEILEGIKLTLYNSGHIAGGSCIYLIGKEGSFFYSGDFSLFLQNTVGGAKIPKLRPDAAIFESTYGDKLHSNRQIEEDRLLELARTCIENNGKMLIPAFALGRAQEILLILKKAMNNNKLKKVNVYVDGMIKNINRVYKQNPLYLKSSLGKKILRGIEPFYNENIIAVSNNEDREKIIGSKESCIVVSSSGMLTGGPSQYYAEKIASLENGYIVISGYQDEESPGSKLLSLVDSEEKLLEINNKIIPLKCYIDKIGLSAHGDKNEIKALIDRLTPKNIFLVHGEGTVIESLGREVQQNSIGRVYIPKCGETIEITIKNPRKQLSKNLPFKLMLKEDLNTENISVLWEYVRKYYPDRIFTVEELLFIWYGDYQAEDIKIEKLQLLLLNSVYFENDNRRFFMFKAKNAEEVEAALKPKEFKQNEIMEIIQKEFNDYNYKKISYILESKTVILNFDFPKAVPEAIYQQFSQFSHETDWNIEINTQTNMNALNDKLKMLIGEGNIKRISHYVDKNQVVVESVDLNRDYSKEKNEFKELTGFEFIIKGSEAKKDIEENSLVFSSKNTSFAMEQNQAISIIDEAFKYEEFMPYKKSIKAKAYMELYFISPMVGRRYSEKISLLADETGWSIAISNVVNQNKVLSLAEAFCREEEVELKKNPSFHPATQEVTIKPMLYEEDKFKRIKRAFEHNTGCELKIDAS